MNFFERVYAVVRSVPPGQVISYGQVAFLAGNPRMARQVGWAMHACPEDVPWHRVLRKDGSLPELSPESTARQRRLLEKEGVTFDDEGRALRRYFDGD
ncbi:MGMT family protein [Mailhella massiliensis]|uniref:MGMT family protein n=1 Tax=Mailhella massiliensis TaxID=1903261 RepID=A0A921AXN0_9BACT|nr:MGMT family protein [Mailhella massiliensis]HJD98220.1 MGMT family protein [Mailhella massiliensis]